MSKKSATSTMIPFQPGKNFIPETKKEDDKGFIKGKYAIFEKDGKKQYEVALKVKDQDVYFYPQDNDEGLWFKWNNKMKEAVRLIPVKSINSSEGELLRLVTEDELESELPKTFKRKLHTNNEFMDDIEEPTKKQKPVKVKASKPQKIEKPKQSRTPRTELKYGIVPKQEIEDFIKANAHITAENFNKWFEMKNKKKSNFQPEVLTICDEELQKINSENYCAYIYDVTGKNMNDPNKRKPGVLFTVDER
jgi:hypothetical protein